MGGSGPAPEKVTTGPELWRVSSCAGMAVVVRLSMEVSSATTAGVAKSCIVGRGY